MACYWVEEEEERPCTPALVGWRMVKLWETKGVTRENTDDDAKKTMRLQAPKSKHHAPRLDG